MEKSIVFQRGRDTHPMCTCFRFPSAHVSVPCSKALFHLAATLGRHIASIYSPFDRRRRGEEIPILASDLLRQRPTSKGITPPPTFDCVTVATQGCPRQRHAILHAERVVFPSVTASRIGSLVLRILGQDAVGRKHSATDQRPRYSDANCDRSSHHQRCYCFHSFCNSPQEHRYRKSKSEATEE